LTEHSVSRFICHTASNNKFLSIQAILAAVVHTATRQSKLLQAGKWTSVFFYVQGCHHDLMRHFVRTIIVRVQAKYSVRVYFYTRATAATADLAHFVFPPSTHAAVCVRILLGTHAAVCVRVRA
jgi:hypothetical protein